MKLKNYFQIGIGLGLVTALVGSIVWIKNGYSSPPVAVVEEPQEPLDAGPDSRLEEDIAATNEAKSPGPASASGGAAKKPEPVDLAKASEAFAQGLKQLGGCLKVNIENVDRIDPTFANLLAAVKQNFGDPIMQSQDWIVWNLKAAGEDRRIRIETDYSDSQSNNRNLRYFKIDAQGTPSLIPLPAEQTRNPSDAFIASLQKDGEVYQEEKGLRGYFENGQELTATEHDGKVDDLEITNGPKTFRCAGILSAASSCKCF